MNSAKNLNVPPGYQRVLDASISLHLSVFGDDTTGDGTENNPWFSINKVQSYLSDVYIADGATVSVVFETGVFNYGTNQQIINHPQATQISFTGVTLSININSVHSISGSVPTRSLILNVSTTVGVQVGDYVLIRSVTGGTNPKLLEGCWEITGLDSGNSRITVSYTGRSAAAPSGSTSSTSTLVLKTVLKWSSTTNGILVQDPCLATQMIGLALVGGNNTSESGIGVSCADIGVAMALQNVGISNFGIGLYSTDNGNITSTAIAVSNCYNGLVTDQTGSMGHITLAVTGCTNYGIRVMRGSSFDAPNSNCSSNGNHGISVESASSASLFQANLLYNTGSGAVVTGFSAINLGQSNTNNNGSSGAEATFSSALEGSSANFNTNGARGVRVLDCSSAILTSATTNSNTNEGVQVGRNSSLSAAFLTANSNSGAGLTIFDSSSALLNSATITNNSLDGVGVFDGSSASLLDATVTGHTTSGRYGVISQRRGSVVVNGANVSSNANGLLVRDDSVLLILDSTVGAPTVRGNTGTGVVATAGGYAIVSSGIVLTGGPGNNGTNYSLTLNTEASEGAYIQQ